MPTPHNHTPTPWTCQDHIHPSDQVFDTTGTIVADCKWTKHVPAQREANAAFIVRACNSHDELLEALGNLLRQTKHFMELSLRYDGQLIQAVKNAESIIAKAEGR